jgi:phosphatidylglycerol:prolipoprotein diacylglycerol transferase
MLPYPNINPIAFTLGPLKVHWYGLMYLFAFLFVWMLGNWRAKRSDIPLNNDMVADSLFYGALGVVIGGRLGYLLFYDFLNFFHHPLLFFKTWQGGMSFHGGLIGVCVALLLFGRKQKIAFFDLCDFYAPMVPIGLGLGRIGNFINGELYGRITTNWFSMVFPDGGPYPRFPSQLIEFALEGLVLFLFMMFVARKPRPRMLLSALFLCGYSVARFSCEFFREPDPQRGYLAFGWLTEGQLLSIPMFIFGVILCVWIIKKRSA